jgi:Domain of unknown function (DUF4351)
LSGESLQGTEEYRPQFRYLLIDQGRYDDRELARSQHLVATLFRLEHGCRRDQFGAIASALMERLSSAGLFRLRRAFGVWLERVSRARLARAGAEGSAKLWEQRSMLSEKFDRWEAEILQEGRPAGEATLLTRQLGKRFGDIPGPVLTRVGAAPASQLERWGERLFDAGTLSEVFEGD